MLRAAAENASTAPPCLPSSLGFTDDFAILSQLENIATAILHLELRRLALGLINQRHGLLPRVDHHVPALRFARRQMRVDSVTPIQVKRDLVGRLIREGHLQGAFWSLRRQQHGRDQQEEKSTESHGCGR